MTKSEIRNFKANICGVSAECEVPFSLEEAARAVGADVSKITDEVTFCSSVYLDSSALTSRFIYLRITDAPNLVSVRVGGTEVHSTEWEEQRYSINIKSALKCGENLIELVFAPHAVKFSSGIGVFGSVELVRFAGALIDGIAVKQSLSSKGASLGIELQIIGSADNVRAVATLVSGSGQVYYGGLAGLHGTINVKDPLYWWPKGIGVQNLYKLTVNLYGEMEIEDTLETRIGIRTFTASHSANASMVEVNGVAFLPMGAVYVPERRVDPRAAKMREAALLGSAARAGYNTLLIPADAPCPGEQFFELCDAYGIAVIVGISLAQQEDTRKPARIRLVSHHASMALADVVGDESLLGDLRERMSRAAPGLDSVFSAQAAEYISHYSLPCERTLLQWLEPEHRNLFSEKIEACGEQEIHGALTSAAKSYPYAGSLSDFAYISQIDAANKVKEFVIATRMARGTLGRAIFSRLGDSEFTVSDSAVDSFARWKALQYTAARCFAPVALRAEYKGKGYVAFSVSNERRSRFVGTLEFRIADRFNKTIYTENAPCEVEMQTSKLLFARELAPHIVGREQEVYLECVLRDGTGVCARDVLLFTPPKRFAYADPQIRADVTGADKRFSLTLCAAAFASAVEISFPETECVLSDNYIDLTSSAPIKITVAVTGGIETAEHLNRTVRLRSVYHVKFPKA